MPLTKIGRYNIKSELGRGGMATVYHAYDPRFERDVAIKVLPHAFLHDPQFRTRFEREAKMIALLEHPAIVPVYDFGEQDGQPYIVMRYMAGGSLADRLKQGPVPLDETSRIITRLAPALDAAHARGIIHRDLKPGNILFDQYGNAFLSDFGIARLAQQQGATITGTAILGTPAYMSPEQVQGEKQIDARSDLYAMGVLIYQMLTGKQPYRADTPAKVMMMHILEPAPNILEDKADLPEACAPVIAKAMAKDPDDRFTTTAELAQALEAASNSEYQKIHLAAAQDDSTMVSGRTVIAGRGGGPPPGGPGATLVSPSKPHLTPLPSAASPAKRVPAWILTLAAVTLIGGAIIVFGGLALSCSGDWRWWATMAAAPWRCSPRAHRPPPPPNISRPRPSRLQRRPPARSPQTRPWSPLKIPPPRALPPPTRLQKLPPSPSHPPRRPRQNRKSRSSGARIKSPLSWMAISGLPTWMAQICIIYIQGKCAQSVRLSDGRLDIITCFNFVDSLKSFEISPDGQKVAVSLDNQLYIVPYDLERLNQVRIRTDLTAMAECQDHAPYERNFVTAARWSRDGTLLAAKIIANLGNGLQGDIIQLIPVDQCIPNPRALDNFPPPRFEMQGYAKHPVIQNFAWDGMFLFALNSMVRNDGFGDLYIYNSDLHKARLKINPVDDVCCYRDPQWSPDGAYLAFAFQNYLGGANSVTEIYLVQYGSIGTGAQYQPLPLPAITNPKEKPQPILRPAR